jgi:carbonic anhydrase/acetyltransferase-like protein (isoleucine patch superfamily)
MIKSYRSFIPQIAKDVFIADNAVVIGEVEIGELSSIWYHAVLRGDVGAIRIGRRSNLQDGVIVHCTTGRSPAVVGNDVVVGHRAILHGCTIGDEVLVGMGAIILDDAEVPPCTVIAAGSLVLERQQLESGYLYAGSPAQKIKPLKPEHLEMIRRGAAHYADQARWHAETKAIDL